MSSSVVRERGVICIRATYTNPSSCPNGWFLTSQGGHSPFRSPRRGTPRAPSRRLTPGARRQASRRGASRAGTAFESNAIAPSAGVRRTGRHCAPALVPGNGDDRRSERPVGGHAAEVLDGRVPLREAAGVEAQRERLGVGMNRSLGVEHRVLVGEVRRRPGRRGRRRGWSCPRATGRAGREPLPGERRHRHGRRRAPGARTATRDRTAASMTSIAASARVQRNTSPSTSTRLPRSSTRASTASDVAGTPAGRQHLLRLRHERSRRRPRPRP